MDKQDTCVLCKTGGSMYKYIDTEHSQCSNLPFRTVLENALKHKVKFETNLCICVNCLGLLNELDLADFTYKRVLKTILNYFGFIDCVTAKAHAYSQTDSMEWLFNVDENVSEPIRIEEEFLCEKFEIEYVKNEDYKCENCSASFPSKRALISHVKKQHETNITIINDQISTTEPETTGLGENDDANIALVEYLKFNNYDDIKIRKTPTSKNPSIKTYFKCAVCSKSWRHKKNLEKHIIKHHIDQQPFICEICGQSYKRLNDLNMHIGRHNGVYPYTCSYCSKAFVKRAALRNHLPIHTGEARFQCDLCGKRFIHHSSLRVHKLCHSGHKGYKCLQCGLSLFAKSHFDRHMRVHTGEKSYKCKLCNKAFAERYNLISHQKIHQFPVDSGSTT